MTNVIILATLHQFHLKSHFYSLDYLKTMIKKINPDVISVELTEKDLKNKKDQSVKIEYSKCIIPVAEKENYKLVAMEPNEPEYSKIVDKYKQNYKKIESKEPKKMEIFNQYTQVLYDYLFAYWNSVNDVNSQQTNTLFEVKHRFQNALFGSVEDQCWEEWNNHFLNTILKVTELYKGKKVLITVGVEHIYWLKKNLKSNSTIRLINIDEALDK